MRKFLHKARTMLDNPNLFRTNLKRGKAMIDLYLSFCKRCNSKTPHLVHAVSRTKGFKIKCAKCGLIKSRYYNVQILEPYKKKEVMNNE